ncbi:hypothetical protein KY349_00625 [Candidatus Woesearchaeota archaeon]|jgi:hypothetical protein|nr:hypothetical protein [Candidatus Woesearchaeota archaeon]
MVHRKRLNRKAQAATEFIHTYGWVILAIIVLGGAMLYYNTSRATYFLPLECSFLSGVNCLDADVDQTLLSIVVVNEFGFVMSNITANMTGTCNSTANTTDGNPYGNLNVLLANQQTLYVFECQNISGMRVTEHITFGYRNVETGQEHIKKGKLEYSPTG